ncbi:MAG: TetR/AcrR family transcriptional regulator [Thermodesulfobacteriota bacterium]
MSARPSTYAKTEDRKQEILSAALACFTEKGFAETTMKDVARRSGASNGSIYHHFGAKEGLARALYLSGIAEYQNTVAAGLTDKTDARRGVESMITGHLSWVAENPGWARFLSTTRHAAFMERADPEMAELNRAWAGKIIAWHTARQGPGRLSPQPPVIFLSLILGPSQELTRLWLAGVAQGSPTDYADELSRSAWQAVKAR